MAYYEIIVGSMLGASEYVADALADTLQSNGYNSQIHLQPELAELDNSAIWILCSSTHGAGELPDNIQPFAESLKQAQLPGQKYMIVALGDSSYDTFCKGGEILNQLMQQSGASLLYEPLKIDVLEHPVPEDVATEWLTQQL